MTDKTVSPRAVDVHRVDRRLRPQEPAQCAGERPLSGPEVGPGPHARRHARAEEFEDAGFLHGQHGRVEAVPLRTVATRDRVFAP